MINHQKQFVLIIGILLCLGFCITSFASFYVSKNSIISQIKTSELPLTSDNVYSEIQNDLLQPIFISSLMATDTFLRDWILQGEKDETQIQKYLQEIQNRYNTVTSFLVSERSQTYYHYKAPSRKISPDENRDNWYFQAKTTSAPYETNVDLDQANHDAMTIFVNYKVLDYNGNLLGITGIGLTVRAVKDLIHTYQKKYRRNIYFTDLEGAIVLQETNQPNTNDTIYQVDGLSAIAPMILSSPRGSATFERQGKTVHINSRFIPELDWYLLVEQEEDIASSQIFKILIINLAICIMVTIVTVMLLNFTLNAYRKKLTDQITLDMKLKKINRYQEVEISAQNRKLQRSNTELEKALEQVQQLSGFLPICASCKKIRDDQGYWNQIETYIEHHSEAEFSHSICPQCAAKLYPEIFPSPETKKEE